MNEAGLMAEAAIGGQKFSVAPLEGEAIPAGAQMQP
jgi:hypothetical protein